MAINKTNDGKLRQDFFVTDTRSNYTFEGSSHTYDATADAITIGLDNTDTASNTIIRDTAWLNADAVITLTFDFVTSYSTTNSGVHVFGRWTNGGTYYYVKFDYQLDTVTLYKYTTSGTVLISQSYVQSYHNNHKIKFQLIGSSLKVKIWKINLGETEPTSWLLEATDSSYTGTGNFQAQAFKKKTYLDSFQFYAGNTIVCHNLPEGYKVRVAGISGEAVGTVTSPGATGGTATADCSHITFPVNAVEFLNASDVLQATYTATGNVWGGDVFQWVSDGTPVIISCDTSRTVKKTVQVNGDTKRGLRKAFTVLVDTLRQITDGTFTQNTTGILKNEMFTSNPASNSDYQLTGTTTWDNVNDKLVLSDNTASNYGKLRDIAFNQADTILCIKVDHTGTVSTSISSTSISIRGDASGNWYWVILNEQANTFNLYSYNGGTFTETLLDGVPFTLARDVPYKIKLSAIGDQIKAKVWVFGDPEPQSWQLEATNSLSQGGKWQVFAQDLIGEFASIHIYNSHLITVTNLGINKVRISGQTFIADGSGTVTANCEHITFPQSSLEILNSNNDVVYTHSGTIWGGDSYQWNGATQILVQIFADTYRRTLKAVTVPTDTRRKPTKATQFVADTTRKIVNSVSMSSDTVRKTIKVITVAGDTQRKTLTHWLIVFDTQRKTLVNTLVNSDTYRKVRNMLTVAGDTSRKVLTSVAVAGDVARKVVLSAVVWADTRRKTLGNAVVVSDTIRGVTNAVTIAGDTMRKTSKTVQMVADTTRKTLVNVVFLADTLRIVSFNVVVHVFVDTQRKVVKSVTVAGDTMRKTLFNWLVAPDTRRSVQNSVFVSNDTRRKVVKALQVQADTKRKLLANIMVLADTLRAATFVTVVHVYLDTLRKVVNAVSVNSDTKRKPTVLTSVVGDAKRKATNAATIVADTRRKTTKLVQLLLDTKRIITDFVISLFHKNAGFKIKELPFKYQWKEFKAMAKILKVGEEREVGLEVSTTDASDFVILTATYEWKDAAGEVIASGDATVDGYRIFTLLKPQAEGYSQTVEFRFKVTPLDANGNPDLTKNDEILEPVIEKISVKP